MLPLSGINLIEQNGDLYVSSASKFCGLYGDLCLFRVDYDSIFKKKENYEYLDLSKRQVLENIFMYYHMKFIKSDFGIGNYNLKDNSKSIYYTQIWMFLKRTKLIPLEEIAPKIQMPILTLQELGIKKTRKNFKKEAFKYLKAQGGHLNKKILLKWVKFFIINYLKKVFPFYKNIILKR